MVARNPPACPAAALAWDHETVLSTTTSYWCPPGPVTIVPARAPAAPVKHATPATAATFHARFIRKSSMPVGGHLPAHPLRPTVLGSRPHDATRNVSPLPWQ